MNDEAIDTGIRQVLLGLILGTLLGGSAVYLLFWSGDTPPPLELVPANEFDIQDPHQIAELNKTK